MAVTIALILAVVVLGLALFYLAVKLETYNNIIENYLKDFDARLDYIARRK